MQIAHRGTAPGPPPSGVLTPEGNTMHQAMPAEKRHRQIMDLLEERHPEDRDVLLELSELTTTLMCEAEDHAIARHGQMILAAIRGDLIKDDDCAALYRPGWADEMLVTMVPA